MKPFLITLSLCLFLLNIAQWAVNAELTWQLKTLEKAVSHDSDAIDGAPVRWEIAGR